MEFDVSIPGRGSLRRPALAVKPVRPAERVAAEGRPEVRRAP